MTNTATRTSLAIPRIAFAAFLRRTFPDLPGDIRIRSVSLSEWAGGDTAIDAVIEYEHREMPLRIATPPELLAIGNGAVDVETEEVISEDPPELPDLTLVEPEDDDS